MKRLEDSNGAPVTDVQLGWMIAAATDLLYVISGRQWRSGHSVIRPCAANRAISFGSMVYPWNSLLGYGSGWGFGAGWAMWSMGLGYNRGSDATELVLQGPITAVESVLLDGVALGAGDYEITGRKTMVLRSGLVWPWEQDRQQPVTQAGTAQVTYDWGASPPPSGRLACAELAIELALSFSGQDSCRLPARVQTVATEGVNVAVGDAIAYIKEDLMAIPSCDYFLRAFNKNHLRRRSVFVGPSSLINRPT
jgi:hypothetical protein